MTNRNVAGYIVTANHISYARRKSFTVAKSENAMCENLHVQPHFQYKQFSIIFHVITFVVLIKVVKPQNYHISHQSAVA